MAKKTWTVEIKGLVSHPSGLARVSVLHGLYGMKETAEGDHLVSGNGQPDFTWSVIEVSTYVNEKHVEISGGPWP